MTNRRSFLKRTAMAGLALNLPGVALSNAKENPFEEKKIGIIGLDTSHVVAFTKEFNEKKSDFTRGYKIVAAYPIGSPDIEVSVSRRPEYVETVKKMGVKIVDSIEELVKEVDYVFLESNDGRPHLEQAIPVFQAGKPLFIDKPIAGSLEDAITLFKLSDHYKVPMFSASSLRYMDSIKEVLEGSIGKVLGADTYAPATLEKTHPDFFWYGIHGVEPLFTVLGTGCKKVTRIHTPGTDIAVGVWEDGRVGCFRGRRTGKHTYGGTAYGEKGEAVLGPYSGYVPLLKEIVRFFDTGVVPVKPKETLEIFAFMAAADESKLIGGGTVDLEEVMNRAERKSENKFNKIVNQ